MRKSGFFKGDALKRVLVIDSTYPVNTRTRKIAESLGQYSSVTVCAWNRGDPCPVGSNDRVLAQPIGYGKKWRKLLALYGFYRHVERIVEEFRPDMVVASHWECMFIAARLKQKHTFRLVYDCLDVPTAASPRILKLLWLLERHFFRYVDIGLFASRFFPQLYPATAGEKIVLENLPPESLRDEPLPLQRTGRSVVSWIGVVRYFDTLKHLVDACALLPEVELHVFGDGQDLQRLKDYCSGKVVVFHGRYRPENLPSIYAFSDLVWAAYPSSDFNVRYAISNKYHECLKFGVPGLFSRSTMLGEMVDNAGTGVSVDEGDIADISAAIRRGLSLRPASVDVMSWEQAFRLVLPRILGE